MRTLLTLLLTAALVATAPHAQAADGDTNADGDAYTLRYKFKTGDVIRYDVDHKANIRSTVERTSQEAKSRTESVKAWKVLDVMPDGEIELQTVVESVRMTNRLPDRAEMVYDSQKDKKPTPGFEDAAKAVGVPLSTIRMSGWGEVIDRKVEHQQPAADPNAPITVLLPEQPIAVGDSWDEPQEIKVKLAEGGTKMIQTRRHFTLQSVKNGVANIKATQQVLSTVTPAIEAQLAQRLMTGTIRFDIERGRILSQQMDVDKRVLGFAGPTSSMHYVMRMTERLIDSAAAKTARRK